MDRVLTDFVKVLRNANVEVSPAETMDAISVIDAIGYANKKLLKRSLAVALPKTLEEKQQFSKCFDAFFSEDFNKETKEKEQPFNDISLNSDLAKHLKEDSQAELMLAIEKAADKSEIREIKYFTQRSVFTRRILEEMGVGDLENELMQIGAMNSNSLPTETEQQMRNYLKK